MSFLFVNTPILNNDFVMLRQLNAWNNWAQERTINATVLARSIDDFSTNRTKTKDSKLHTAIKTLWRRIDNILCLVIIASFRERGERSIMFGSMGSIPSANAGNPSVTTFIQSIWIGSSGNGSPINEAVNITSISPILQESR